MTRRTGLQLLVLLALIAMLAPSCGRTPAAGLEGELCAADNDCMDGLICVRRSCLPLEYFDVNPDIPDRGGLFFVVLNLDTWTGAEGGQLEQFGNFISDLSTVLTPYYGLWANTETQARFGVVDSTMVPIHHSTEHTVTVMFLAQEGSTYEAVQDTLLMPVVYADDSVDLDFEMPLSDARITVVAPDTSVGSSATVRVTGALRAVDSRDLVVIQGEEEFTLWDVLRGDPLDYDVDGDGVNDSWGMSWSGTGELL